MNEEEKSKVEKNRKKVVSRKYTEKDDKKMKKYQEERTREGEKEKERKFSLKGRSRIQNEK